MHTARAPPPCRRTRAARAVVGLAVLGLAAAASAALASVPAPEPAAAGPTCIHDKIVAKQLGGLTLAQARARGHVAVATTTENATARAMRADYAPLRITVFHEDVDNSSKYCTNTGQMRPDFQGADIRCTNDDILTPSKRTLLLQTMIPKAIDMLSERLRVIPRSTFQLGNSLAGNICGEFTAPADVVSGGVKEADFAIFVAAGPVTGSTIAWAATCGYGADNAPFVGVMNVKPKYIDGTDQSIRTLAHELLHALGFHGPLFKDRGMMTTIADVRGRPSTPVITSAGVVQRAGNQFGCDKTYGMELDDSGGAGTAGSHWSVRNARDDIMCGYVGPAMKLSAITLAAMEDTGYYKADYTKAEHMEWGFRAGCDLQKKKCVWNGKSRVPSMFCASPPADVPSHCTADRLAAGYCERFTYTEALPEYFRYFSDPTHGGEQMADFCPSIMGFTNTRCDGSDKELPNSVFGPDSKCFDVPSGSRLPYPICAKVLCNEASKTYTVRFRGATAAVRCPPGKTVDAGATSSSMPTGSTVRCPPYGAVCATTFNSLGIRVKLLTESDYSGDGASPPARAAALAAPMVAAAVALAASFLV